MSSTQQSSVVEPSRIDVELVDALRESVGKSVVDITHSDWIVGHDCMMKGSRGLRMSRGRWWNGERPRALAPAAPRSPGAGAIVPTRYETIRPCSRPDARRTRGVHHFVWRPASSSADRRGSYVWASDCPAPRPLAHRHGARSRPALAASRVLARRHGRYDRRTPSRQLPYQSADRARNRHGNRPADGGFLRGRNTSSLLL